MNYLKQFVRNQSGERIGVVVAIKDNNGFRLGWSVCNPKDQFNNEMGTRIAIGRAINGSNAKIPNRINKRFLWTEFGDNIIISNAVQDTISGVINRARKYFKAV